MEDERPSQARPAWSKKQVSAQTQGPLEGKLSLMKQARRSVTSVPRGPASIVLRASCTLARVMQNATILPLDITR
ncbi:MAG TPA: hypothetical protein ENK23_05610 [Sorangium sp.]|nr:hypothetical protein [Sorangium sp.]